MAILAGENLTAGRLMRLQPKPHFVKATSALAASSTNVDVPGCSIAFTTEAANAIVQCSWSTDFNLSGATTTLGSSRLLLDSVTASDALGVFQAEVATDRSTVAQFCQFTIAAAGAHAIRMQGTTPANMTIDVHSMITLLVIEVA